LLPGLDRDRLPLALEIARSADAIRGYGPVKAGHVAQTRRRWAELMVRWRAHASAAEPEAVRQVA
jgi:indolepyruvate ferredoxin oxidoreductase